jgi:NADH-quinone oxidoreductase subunit K
MNNTINVFDHVPLLNFIVLAFILFSIGVVGVLTRRNLIVVFLSIELMLNSINILAVAFSKFHNDPGAQTFVFFIMIVAAAEVAVGLGMLVMIYKNTRSLDINTLSNLKW